MIDAITVLNFIKPYTEFIISNLWILLLVYISVAATIFFLTFVCYLAIMLMKLKKSEIYKKHWSVRWACYLTLFIGLGLDTLLNWWLLTVAFFELPKEFLSTTRVTRHKYDSTHWRQTQARWWCENWLEPFDIGHCWR